MRRAAVALVLLSVLAAGSALSGPDVARGARGPQADLTGVGPPTSACPVCGERFTRRLNRSVDADDGAGVVVDNSTVEVVVRPDDEDAVWTVRAELSVVGDPDDYDDLVEDDDDLRKLIERRLEFWPLGGRVDDLQANLTESGVLRVRFEMDDFVAGERSGLRYVAAFAGWGPGGAVVTADRLVVRTPPDAVFAHVGGPAAVGAKPDAVGTRTVVWTEGAVVDDVALVVGPDADPATRETARRVAWQAVWRPRATQRVVNTATIPALLVAAVAGALVAFVWRRENPPGRDLVGVAGLFGGGCIAAGTELAGGEGPVSLAALGVGVLVATYGLGVWATGRRAPWPAEVGLSVLALAPGLAGGAWTVLRPPPAGWQSATAVLWAGTCLAFVGLGTAVRQRRRVAAAVLLAGIAAATLLTVGLAMGPFREPTRVLYVGRFVRAMTGGVVSVLLAAGVLLPGWACFLVGQVSVDGRRWAAGGGERPETRPREEDYST